ncbi:hypothetical protein SLA2020_380990 [Shorea laevis]
MAHRSTALILSTLFMVLILVLLLQQNFGSVEATRLVSSPKPESTDWFRVNRYKKIEGDAFRPTSPGHSPGVGHGNPPAAP